MGKGSAGEEGYTGIMICLFCCLGLPLIIGILAMCILFLYYGFKFQDSCPADKMIPIWSIVQGFSMLVGSGFSANSQKKTSDGADAEDQNKGVQCFKILLQLFQTVWVIYGSVLVFGCGDQCENDFEPITNTGCAHDLYWMNYVSLIISYSLLPVIIVVVIVVMCCTNCLPMLKGEGLEGSSV